MAIDRDAINESVYNGLRTSSTGVTPPGIPGFAENICDYCAYDPEAAQAAYDEWLAAGNEPETIPIQFNADAGHEPVVAIFVDNLAAIGIEAEADPRITETYFSELADGACVICRAGWIADYPTYDNFMYDLFHTESIGFNNYAGVSIPEFDAVVDEAKQTTDPDAQAALFQEAEDILLNQVVDVIPINWYLGDYAFNTETVASFTPVAPRTHPVGAAHRHQVTPLTSDRQRGDVVGTQQGPHRHPPETTVQDPCSASSFADCCRSSRRCSSPSRSCSSCSSSSRATLPT